MTFDPWDGFDAGIPIRDLALSTIRLYHSELEEMAERMLTDPEGRGIMVILDPMASFDEQLMRFTGTRTYRLDPGVPFGHIFEFPSEAAVDEWRARGCPQ
jgi:hypothetical protein